MGVPAKTLSYVDWSAQARLGTLGLDVDVLAEVVRRGEVGRAQFTENDPLNAAGWDAYRFRVRALRELYRPFGWRVIREGGLELIGAPAKDGMRILTKAGNSDVGLLHRDANPQPEYDSKGSTELAMGANATLYGQEWMSPQDIVRPEHELWMLLVYYSETEIRSELSLGLLTDREVKHWFERIILPVLNPDDLTPKRYTFEKPDADAIDVPVIRKRK